MILQISVIAHSCQAYLYQGMSFLANRFWAAPNANPAANPIRRRSLTRLNLS